MTRRFTARGSRPSVRPAYTVLSSTAGWQKPIFENLPPMRDFPQPVSYTHLDVYKRQYKNNTCDNCHAAVITPPNFSSYCFIRHISPPEIFIVNVLPFMLYIVPVSTKYFNGYSPNSFGISLKETKSRKTTEKTASISNKLSPCTQGLSFSDKKHFRPAARRWWSFESLPGYMLSLIHICLSEWWIRNIPVPHPEAHGIKWHVRPHGKL